MMGAGKSSVGRLLQKRTGFNRFDTDELVRMKLGLTIPEIFARHGEEQFRAAERLVLLDLVQLKVDNAIFVTGGGVVLRDDNIASLKQLGTVIWLDANEETLFQRASLRPNRPLLKSNEPRATFSGILRERASLYAKAADFRIDTTSLTHGEVGDVILHRLEHRIRNRTSEPSSP